MQIVYRTAMVNYKALLSRPAHLFKNMHNTVFDNPIIKFFLKRFSCIVLKMIGWRALDKREGEKKYLMLAAPHTSNWDFPIFLLIGFTLEIKAYWLGKNSLFKWPFGGLFRWLGGIPVDRSKNSNMVQQCIDHFNSTTELIIVTAPEGTRSRVKKWKTGFYHIANGANVAIALGYLDYKDKQGGIAGVFQPTGEIDSDLKKIKAFYAGISGRHLGKYVK